MEIGVEGCPWWWEPCHLFQSKVRRRHSLGKKESGARRAEDLRRRGSKVLLSQVCDAKHRWRERTTPPVGR